MSSPSSLLLPENGDDWPIRMPVLLTPWAWARPPANRQASAPTAAVNARIVVIALSPRPWGKSAAEISALIVRRLIRPPSCEDAPHCRFYTANGNRGPRSPLLREECFDLLHPRLCSGVVPIAVRLADRLELAQQLP